MPEALLLRVALLLVREFSHPSAGLMLVVIASRRDDNNSYED